MKLRVASFLEEKTNVLSANEELKPEKKLGVVLMLSVQGVMLKRTGRDRA